MIALLGSARSRPAGCQAEIRLIAMVTTAEMIATAPICFQLRPSIGDPLDELLKAAGAAIVNASSQCEPPFTVRQAAGAKKTRGVARAPLFRERVLCDALSCRW